MAYYIKIVILLLFFVLSACKSEQDQTQPQMRTAHSQEIAPGALSYRASDDWIKEPPSSTMRIDQYRLPGSGGAEDAELAVFVFPGSGGAVQANIDRWLDQFIQPDKSSSKEKAELKKLSSNGLPVTIVYLTGTFLKGAMGGPMSGSTQELPGYALLGAIVETSKDPWFFKAVGPQVTIDRWRESFEKFIQSISQK